MKAHHYKVKVEWTGKQGEGTANYKSYSRDHTISAMGKYSEINASSDPAFMGDRSRYNPEELFLSSLSSCHMLWYLHLCSTHGIVVIEYSDEPIGTMEESENGSGKFTSVTLHPTVKITNKDLLQKASELHEKANKMCFIANSCNFKITHQAKIVIG